MHNIAWCILVYILAVFGVLKPKYTMYLLCYTTKCHCINLFEVVQTQPCYVAVCLRHNQNECVYHCRALLFQTMLITIIRVNLFTNMFLS